jgi:hypothetical protein
LNADRLKQRADRTLTNNKPDRWASARQQGTIMIKALSAISIAAFIAAALTILPGFAPEVEASVPVALSKGDRLDIRTRTGCSQQTWPNFDPSCLHKAGSKAMTITEVRLVTATQR